MALRTQDLVHEHVQYYLKTNPDAQKKIQRKAEGRYAINGREVKIGFCAQNYLVVQDGPLRQPFTDYMEGNEASAVYHQGGLNESCLNQVPKDFRMSFADEDAPFSRIESMKIAKEQAFFREKAANYVKQGKAVPPTLMTDYEKIIDQKIGKSFRKLSPAQEELVSPSWWPGSTNKKETQSASGHPLRHAPTNECSPRGPDFGSARAPISRMQTPAPTNELSQPLHHAPTSECSPRGPHPGSARAPISRMQTPAPPNELPAFRGRLDGSCSVPFPQQILHKSDGLWNKSDGSSTVPHPRPQRQSTATSPPVPCLGNIYGAVPGASTPRMALPNPNMVLHHLSPRTTPSVRAMSPSMQAVAVQGGSTASVRAVSPSLQAVAMQGSAPASIRATSPPVQAVAVKAQLPMKTVTPFAQQTPWAAYRLGGA